MTKRIVVAGSGFAGMWAAISAARAVALAGKEQGLRDHRVIQRQLDGSPSPL